MKRFIEGQDRQQITLLPKCLDDYVDEDKVDKGQEQIEHSIQRYLDALKTADRTQPTEVEAKTERLQEKIRRLREQMQQLDEVKRQLKEVPDGQIFLTDPDARSMVPQAKGSGLVTYNVQATVDSKHHLITDSARWRTVWLYTPTGAALAPPARSRSSARHRTTGASSDGNTKTCWSACNSGWTATPTQ